MTIYLKIIKTVFSKKEVKMTLVSTLAGGALQIICRRYLEEHPDIKIDNLESVDTFNPRGGAVVQFTGFVVNVFINLFAQKGALAGLIFGTGVTSGILINKIPASAISTFLRDAFPQNLPDLEKTKFTLVEGEKIYMDHCEQNLKYLFKILKDQTIPYEEKEKLAWSTLDKYLNLGTMKGRVNFVLCMVSILVIFSQYNTSGLYILTKKLIKAIKEGKISKAMARAIVRRLVKKNIPIDSELIDIIKD